MDATFPLADRPRLRAVEVIPVQITGNGRGVWLRDPADPEIQPLSVSAAGVEVLMLLDGRRTIDDIAAGLALRGVSIGEPQVRDFLARLDEGGFLEGARFQYRLEQRKAAFMAYPVRPAVHAGGAYPSGREELARLLTAAYTDRDGPGVPPPPLARDAHAPALRAIIAPHVDLHRGAPTYSWAYRAVADSQPAELYVILGTCHTPVPSHFAATRKAYDTPLGPMPTDGAFLDRLSKLYGHDLYEGELSHAGEHSIEFQAVYLRWLGVRAPIVPLLCDSLHSMVPSGKSPRSVPLVREFIDGLREAMAQDGRRITLIAAVDLAHVGQRFGDRWLVDRPHQTSVERGDREMLDCVFEPNADAYYAQVLQDRDARRICGLTPIYILTALMESEQRRGELLRYTQWVDTDLSSSVTFASAIFR